MSLLQGVLVAVAFLGHAGASPPQQGENYFYSGLSLSDEYRLIISLRFSTPYVNQMMNVTFSTTMDNTLISGIECPADQCLSPSHFSCSLSNTCTSYSQVEQGSY